MAACSRDTSSAWRELETLSGCSRLWAAMLSCKILRSMRSWTSNTAFAADRGNCTVAADPRKSAGDGLKTVAGRCPKLNLLNDLNFLNEKLLIVQTVQAVQDVQIVT